MDLIKKSLELTEKIESINVKSYFKAAFLKYLFESYLNKGEIKLIALYSTLIIRTAK